MEPAWETTGVKDFMVVDRVIKNCSTNLWSSVSLFIGAPSVKTTPRLEGDGVFHEFMGNQGCERLYTRF